MAIKNYRIFLPQAHIINGIANGGLVTHRIQAGYDNILQNPVDGLELSMADFITEFVRGDFTSQDWVHIIELLTGTVGTSVFYERKSGTAEASGYIKHTLNNPVIHKMTLVIQHRGYGNISGSYECRAADETKGITDMWVKTDSQNAPTYVSAARGLEITACALGILNVYHVTRLELTIEMSMSKSSQDGDVGYTAVDVFVKSAYGTLTMQDAEIATSQAKAVQLLKAARGSLVTTIKQSQGATAKTLTIAGVKFTSAGHNTSAPDAGGNPNPDEFSVPFIVTNDVTTQLTLAGTNKIVTIA